MPEYRSFFLFPEFHALMSAPLDICMKFRNAANRRHVLVQQQCDRKSRLVFFERSFLYRTSQ